METLEQTIMQVERFIRKVAQKFPAPESDDDDNEITRCVVEQWIENKDEDFYDEVAKLLRDVLRKQADIIDHLGILKPYSFVLEDDDKEHIGELYLADDDTIIVGGDLMENLDNDLDNFLNDLLKE